MIHHMFIGASYIKMYDFRPLVSEQTMTLTITHEMMNTVAEDDGTSLESFYRAQDIISYY